MVTLTLFYVMTNVRQSSFVHMARQQLHSCLKQTS